MSHAMFEHGDVSTLSWGIFLLVAISAVFVAIGFPIGPLLVFGAIAAMIFAFRSIYLSFYFALALVPFLGIMVSIPTGDLVIGTRAFGGSVDISLAEVLLFFVLFAWACKLILYWWKRRDESWRPRLPLLPSYFFLFAAHLASAFSPLGPDPLPTIKFAFRPVLFDYLAFIALPVNLIRSRRRLLIALGTIAFVGFLAALNGFVSIFFPTNSSGIFGRAHPFPIFGINALGENHNELADWLVVVVPITLACAELIKSKRAQRLLWFAAGFETLIGLCTFTRTIWIVFAIQAMALVVTVWRDAIKRHVSSMILAAVLLSPLVFAMAFYAVSPTAQSSNSTRLALSEIAYQLFTTSPWVGGGAGTFVERVGSARVFVLEYGDPLDSHGFIQKLAAETGLFGVIAFGSVVAHLLYLSRKALKGFRETAAHRVVFLLCLSVLGTFVYQLFNTDYWTGKMWLPVGLLLASFSAMKEPAPRDILPS